MLKSVEFCYNFQYTGGRVYIKVKAFSLIELMIVIAITAILAMVAMPSYKSYKDKVKVTEVKTLVKRLKDQVIEYYSINSVWPKLEEFYSTNETFQYNGTALTNPNQFMSALSVTGGSQCAYFEFQLEPSIYNDAESYMIYAIVVGEDSSGIISTYCACEDSVGWNTCDQFSGVLKEFDCGKPMNNLSFSCNLVLPI